MKLNTAALSTVTLGTPILEAGRYFARITKLEEKPTKDNKGTYINLTLKLHGDELPKHEGGMVKNHGFQIFRGISQVPTEKYDPNKNWKELAMAVGYEGDELEESHLIDKDIAIVLSYRPAEGTYAASNDVARFQKITAADNFNPSF